MQPDRLQGGWKFLLALYLISFALPLSDSWGAAAFIVSLFWGLHAPVFWLFWAANPLFWFGLAAWRKGRRAAATALGCAASACAFLPFPLMIWDQVANHPSHLPRCAAYLAWFASIAGLPAVGLVSWLRSRPQIRIRSLMVLVLAVALALASFPILIRVLRGLLVLPGA